jgi:hypothetical protein
MHLADTLNINKDITIQIWIMALLIIDIHYLEIIQAFAIIYFIDNDGD